MAPPPTPIVPLPVIIAEDRIFWAAERLTVEVVINFCVASPIIGEVPCLVTRQSSGAIDRYAIASTKLIRVAMAIQVDVPCPIDREISLPINRYAVASAKLVSIKMTINVDLPCPINSNVSLAIDGNVASRANVSIARQVSLAIRARSGVLIDYRM
jgi:hypothetical protein